MFTWKAIGMRPASRTGAVVLEAIIGLPILVIALMAIVEFGLLSANQAYVHASSRAGADAAAGIVRQLPASGPVPAEVDQAVSKVLGARGIAASWIRVEHTNGPAPPYALTSGNGGSTPTAAAPTGDYVRVSVCVENTELAPNLLRGFSIDLFGTFSQQTTCRCARIE